MSDEMLSQEEIEALIAQTSGATPGQPAEVSAPAEPSQAAVTQSAPQVVAGPAPQVEPAVRPMEFAPLGVGPNSGARNGVELILDVQLQVTVELGRSAMQVRDVLGLGPGSVVELDTHAGEPVSVVVNNKVIARGEVVVIDENFGVRITEIVGETERGARAKAA